MLAYLTPLQLLGPLAFVAGLYLAGPLLPLARPWARQIVFVAVWAVVGRYMVWRFVDTVLAAQGSATQIAWVWFCFAIEVLALADACILYVAFLRRTDRSAEADAHEARLRRAAATEDVPALPDVDVFIPTFDEPLEIVEKAIVGALCIDYPNFRVWVLDDGRRAWLRDFCAAKGAGYIVRPDNAHAKAGNINHALGLTHGAFVAIFDADFVPQRNFLLRTMGFFDDPAVGIVQTPHAFYNADPMQTNLAVRASQPDDQRLFFDAIMPSRDGWDAAFCCGSNAVIRRAAFAATGGGFPLGSITEDALLSLALLRHGYVTRFLGEHLAFGLAAEGIRAFFVQRQRWARGAMQILRLPEGPLGPGLRSVHRLLFLPTHWVTGGLTEIMSILAPIIFMWTGLAPMLHVDAADVLYYILPMVAAVIGGLCIYAQGTYAPLAAQVLGTFQAFRILPIALHTLVHPAGHAFRVTPKGRAAREASYDRAILAACATLGLFTLGGILLNVTPEWRLVGQSALLPVVYLWSVFNVVKLFLVAMMCLQRPPRRQEERFARNEPVWIHSTDGLQVGHLLNVSLSGAGVALAAYAPGPQCTLSPQPGDFVRLFMRDVGFVTGVAARVDGARLGIRFVSLDSTERDLLIRKLFTADVAEPHRPTSTWLAAFALVRSIWAAPSIESGAGESDVEPSTNDARLPAQTLVIPPRSLSSSLTALAATRRDLVA